MDDKNPAPQTDALRCRTCGGALLQKNRLILFTVGMGMAASLVSALLFPLFWAPGIILGLAGAYLIVWAVLGKGRWCRNCKIVPPR